MADDADTQQLIQSVDRGKKFLVDIKDALTHHLHNRKDAAAPWLREIEQAEQKGKAQKVIIGVVGATGSGKSSVINAILGEKQLVPTNCMRACTAVVTEISYNDSTDCDYRAVIEFVSRREWQHELELLLGDIVVDGEVNADIIDDDCEAGIAFAKVRAVYPHLDRRSLSETTVAELLDYDYIKDLVNTQIEFKTSTSEQLYEKIQKYVDSKEKLIEDFENHGLQASSSLDKIAYWPLIRNVRIYTKASVLESGGVLVDLPGVADSNAARAAIAQKYLQNCAALWVVAPIIRAVDDKSARYLLGETFKRQLFRDETMQRITFICSKTDDISIVEARDALERFSDFKEKFEIIDKDRTRTMGRIKALQRSLSETKQEVEHIAKLQEEVKEEDSEYKKLEARAEDAQSVYPLVRVEVSKRKLDEDTTDVPLTPTKKTKFEDHVVGTFGSPSAQKTIFSSGPTQAPHVQFREDRTKPSLNISQVKKKLESFKLRKAELRDKKKTLKEHEKSMKQDLAANKTESSAISRREWITCVLGRNDLSSRAIRIDFAAGLRDIVKDENEKAGQDDHMPCEKDDSSQASPDTLSIFCVSARGFHKSSGEIRSEKTAACFDSLEDTGIPGLREHVYRLGNDKKMESFQVFLDEVERILTSLKLWSSGDESAASTDSDLGGGNEEVCSQVVDTFTSSIFEVAMSAMDTIANAVETNILGVLPGASTSASQAALLTSTKWVAPRSSPHPGLRYNTYKAVMRRNGSWATRQKSYDFNADLLQPYMRSIDKQWHDVFNVQIDKVFRKALKAGAANLDTFTEAFCARLSAGADSQQSTLCQAFDEQVKLFTKSLGTVFRDARQSIGDQQKEMNRLFEVSVKQQMQKIYKDLGNESGLGQYDRSKEKMKVYLGANKDVMFNKVTKRVTKEVKAMLGEVRGTLSSDLTTSCDSLQRDCGYIYQKSRDFEELPEEARNAIIRVLEDAILTATYGTPVEDKSLLRPDKSGDQGDMLDTLDDDRTRSLPLRSITPRFATPAIEDEYTGSGDSESESSDGDSQESSSADEV